MPGRILSGLHRSRSPSRENSRGSSREHNAPRHTARTSTTSPESRSSTPPVDLAMDAFKRHSISSIVHKAHDSHKKAPSPNLKPSKPKNTIELIRESPPSIFFGPPEASSGILLAGILRVNVVTDPHVVLTQLNLKLLARVTQKKPIVKDCPQCARQDTELKTWDFLTENKTIRTGSHNFPYSHLIPGRLPATSYGRLAYIEYFLLATARTTSNEILHLDEELKLARSLIVPPEKRSLRIFPPTRMEAHLSLVPIIHPLGRFTAEFALKNIVNGSMAKHQELHTRWAVRKLVWKLEEIEHTIAPACSKHSNKVGGEGKGKEYEELRTLARDELFEGWKRDYSGDGAVELEFVIDLPSKPGMSGAPRALCDVETPSGQRVTHQLVIELVVAEEWQHNTKAEKWGPTGQARVLRCQFGLKVTERAGLGVSWDEEEPPLYTDMTQGPPPDYEREFGLPPLTEEQREEMFRQQQMMRRTAGEDWPSSPPLYGVNSNISNYDGPPLEEVLEGLELDQARRDREEMRFGRDDLEVWDESRGRQRSLEGDNGEGPSGVNRQRESSAHEGTTSEYARN